MGLRAAGFFAGAFFAVFFTGLFLRVVDLGFRAGFALDAFEVFAFGVRRVALETGVRLRIFAVVVFDFFCASILRRPFFMAFIN